MCSPTYLPTYLTYLPTYLPTYPPHASMRPYQCPVGGMKYMQQWTLESGILFFLLIFISSCRYASYWSLMNFMMGCQLHNDSDESRKWWGRSGKWKTQFKSCCLYSQHNDDRIAAYQFSLLIWSPKPGVSMTVNFILTPFSSMSAHKETHIRSASRSTLHILWYTLRFIYWTRYCKCNITTNLLLNI